MNNNLFDKALELIQDANYICITTHINTDGDAVSSSLGLYGWLIKKGKKVDVCIDSIIPDNFLSLPNASIINQKKYNKYDLVVALDAADEFRLGKNKQIVLDNKLHSLQFDHHFDANNSFCKTNIIEDISSTCELVADFLFYVGDEIDEDVAKCLITGIFTDTGKLSYACAMPETFEIVSKLLKLSKTTINEILYPIYNSVSMEEFELRKYGYSKVEFFDDYKIAMICLSYEDIQRTHVELYSTKGLLDLVLPLKSVKIVALMTEFTPNTISCSFRTKGNINANELASFYGGGGHFNAAGCKIKKSILEAEKQSVLSLATKLIRKSEEEC